MVISYLRSNQSLHDLLEKIAEEKGVTYIDLYSPETDTSTFFTEGQFHPDERGRRITARRYMGC